MMDYDSVRNPLESERMQLLPVLIVRTGVLFKAGFDWLFYL